MPILQPGAEVKFDVFHRSPIGLAPEDRKASLLALIMVHLLLVFVSSKNPSCSWEWHFGNVGNATEIHTDSSAPWVYFVISLARCSEKIFEQLIIPSQEQNAKAKQRGGSSMVVSSPVCPANLSYCS